VIDVVETDAGVSGVGEALARYAPKAYAALERAARVPGQSINPESSMILLSSWLGKPVKSRWYQEMERSLARRRIPNAQDVSALFALVRLAPRRALYHYDLGVALAAGGRFQAARRELATLKRLDRAGLERPLIRRLSHLIHRLDPSHAAKTTSLPPADS